MRKGKLTMSPVRFISLMFLLLLLSVSLSACGGDAFVPSGWSGVTADDEVAYVAHNQFVYAVRVSDGVQVWRYPQEADRNKSFFAAPALTGDGQVIVGGYNNTLYSLDQRQGTERWNFSAKDRFIASPLVAGERIFAPNADGNLYVLDLKGKSVWVYKAGSSIWATPATDSKCTCIYLATFDHQLYSIDVESGKPVWGPVDVGSAMVGSLALSADGVLYAGTFGKEIVAIRAEDGAILWRVPTAGWVWGGPALDGERLYFGDIDGNFYILNIPDRSIIAQIKPDGPITSTPFVTGDRIYFTTESGTIYAVDRDGNPLWEQTVGGKIHSSPAISGDTILVTPMQTEAILVGLNLGGSQRWQFIPPK